MDMTHFKDGEVIATVTPSQPRRYMGIGCLWALAAIVIYTAVATPPAPGWQLFLLGVGCTSIWVGEMMRRATGLRLELTTAGLRDSAGTELAQIDDILSLDRGVFAFKPSNGFLMRLNTSKGRAWRPGLWWRLGNRIGVGGMVPANQAKFMAEVISAMIAQRDGA